MKCWAWSGRASNVAIRSIEEGEKEEANGHSSETIGKGVLGGAGKLVDTGKGKFGMDIKFVSAVCFVQGETHISHLMGGL